MTTYTVCVARQALLDCRIPIDHMEFDPDAEVYFLPAKKAVLSGMLELFEDGGYLIPDTWCVVVKEHAGAVE